MSNGLPDDFSSSTRFLPGTPVDPTDEPRTTRPLRSTPITGVSALLRAGPPACPAPVLTSSAAEFPLPPSHSLSPPAEPQQCPDTPAHVRSETSSGGSRHLPTGHHLASKRAPARLVPEYPQDPGFDVV